MEKEVVLKKLGNRIRSIREEKGISQANLGRLCDIEPQNMYRIEVGRANATVYTLMRVASALNVKVRDLIDF